jgi:hypothetical protein
MAHSAYCFRVASVHHLVAMPDTEAHQYRLGSPLASIAGIAEATLQRNDLDDDVATRLRAIRDLALDALARAENPREPDSGGSSQA